MTTRKVLWVSAALFAAAVLALGVCSTQAATVYWDIDGSTAGSGPDTTPDETWNTTNTFWNDTADGSGTTAAWSGGDTAVFAAGTDATGSYTVSLPTATTTDIGGLTVEEGGTVTINESGTGVNPVLRITTANATIDVAGGKSLRIANTSIDVNGNTLTIQGAGTTTIYSTDADITGSGILIKDGSGLLVVNPSGGGGGAEVHTFTGEVWVARDDAAAEVRPPLVAGRGEVAEGAIGAAEAGAKIDAKDRHGFFGLGLGHGGCFFWHGAAVTG